MIPYYKDDFISITYIKREDKSLYDLVVSFRPYDNIHFSCSGFYDVAKEKPTYLENMLLIAFWDWVEERYFCDSNVIKDVEGKIKQVVSKINLELDRGEFLAAEIMES